MQRVFKSILHGNSRGLFILLIPLLMASLCTQAGAFSLTVTGSDGALVTAYRWMVEEDNTNITIPGRQVPDALGNKSIAIDIHNSYAPVVAKGHSTAAAAIIDLPSDKPYFVTVLPDGLPPNGVPRYSMNGTTVAAGQSVVRVTVNRMPLPTAQIFLLAYIDHNPISNAKDEREDGLGGCSIYLFDFSGGRIDTDAFGNPLGTTYDTDIFGEPYLDGDGNPVVAQLGDGALTTLSQDDIDAGDNPYNLKLGEALVKYLAPGKYGVRMVPPQSDDADKPLKWVQTATIEGTPTIDAWVQKNEPQLFVEGFGTGVHHAQYGFVNYTPTTAADPGPWMVHGQPVSPLQGNLLNETGNPAGTGTVSGRLRFNHFDRPPNNQGLHPGPIVDQGWVGLNDAVLIAEAELVPLVDPPAEVNDALKPSAGLYAVPCNADGTFTFTGIPPGEYQIVTWDTPLDALFGFHTVTVPAGGTPENPGDGVPVDVGDLLSFRWFGTLEGTIFYDINANGIQDAGELGIPNQAVNLRFRDGSIYQATASGGDGGYELAEVFPFFKWLVAEVDFARFKATGLTTAIDHGGPIADLFAPVWPSNGNKNLQPQLPFGFGPGQDPFNENSDALWRTETGPVLTEAVHLFLNQTNLIDWGKINYGPNENGGISGVIFYDTTRAEDDPRYNGGEPWQPGIPRVQVNLYSDFVNNTTGAPTPDGIIDDRDGSGGITEPDVDNFPFDWYCQGEPGCANTPGPEDIDDGFTGADIASGDGVFDFRDAIEITWSDSWDDNKPSGCIQDLPVIYGFPIPECADTYGTWNQVRPGVFDGGYAFGPEVDCPAGDCPPWVNPSAADPNVGYLVTGNYVVQAVPPPFFSIVRSQDKNVDFGEIFIPSPLALPPVCVGEEYVVPAELTLFPGVPANLAGQTLNDCDCKTINVAQSKNSAADFFMFTEVPKAARVVGFANNDRGAEFNQASPIYGEKLGAPWIPIAFRDWTGKEILRVYADEWGHYNALLPSTYSINVPSPSGVAPNMLTMVLNDPIRPDGSIDPWYNPDFSVTPWTFNYQPGTTTYTDTPLVPVAAFTTAEVGLDTYQADGGPVIREVYSTTAGAGSGPVVCTNTSAAPYSVTLTSLGFTEILNPDWDPTGAVTNPRTIIRDFGFGTSGQVTLDGVPLTIMSWNNLAIVVSIPSGLPTGPDGQLSGTLMVRRADTGISTQLGVYLNVLNCAATTVIRVPGDFPTIQMAIDAAPYTPDVPGALILVAPGTYTENVIMYKPVRLQGAGAGSTFINGNPTPVSLLDAWHARIEPPVAQGGFNGQALENFMLKNIFSENEAPCIIVFGEQYFPGGTVQDPAADPMANVFNPGYRFGTADDYSDQANPVPGQGIPGQARIDGFTLSGSKAGGGIYAPLRARGLEITNNEITNNQGNYAGGISLGVPDAGFQMFGTGDFRDHATGLQNTEVIIRNNKIHKNGGFQGAGGIGIGEDTHDYLVEKNLLTGNYSSFHGGGLAHIGMSDGGVIRDNRILFNENFFGAILQRAGDGGGIYIGGDIAGGTGAGSVTIDGNLIQGNMTGSGSGGGIRAAAVSGEDVRAIALPDAIPLPYPEPWPLYTLTIVNNIIVNNIAGLDGGGISLQDVSRSVIANNTIANNDSTSVSLRAFPAGELSSIPNPGGIASRPHTAILASLWAAAFGSAVPEFSGIPEPTFSDPSLTNNILWHNRSWFFDGTAPTPALAANPAAPFWDLGVIGGPGALTPVNCILSGGADPLFLSEYLNVLDAARVIDEGGNNINIRFTPLEVGVSDYHITAASPGIDAGATVGDPLLAEDFDDDPRPAGAGVDIGADEYVAAVPLADGDGDGVSDSTDNCTLVANPSQVDSNADGFGNACDTDLNNDGITNGLDLGLLRSQFLSAGPDADFNGDGVVNGLDLGILRNYFLQPPGPSAVAP